MLFALVTMWCLARIVPEKEDNMEFALFAVGPSAAGALWAMAGVMLTGEMFEILVDIKRHFFNV